MSTLFKSGDKVEWTNAKGIKQTGTIIETGDNMKHLIKYDSGKYIAIQEEYLRRVNKDGQ